ncbi:MAG: hypothetical protein CL928_06550 [Deltaproteobacteria bacterium]|nr:hypothetical protein [Deltaproteobacteria bacterium]
MKLPASLRPSGCIVHRGWVIVTVLCLSMLLGASAAQAGILYGGRPLWIGVGGAMGGRVSLEGESPGALMGDLGVGLRLLPIVPEVGLRLGPSGDPAIVLGSFWAGVRVMLPSPPFLRPNFRIAFSHMNELEGAKWSAAPFQGLFGTHPDVRHRPGLETSIGLELMADPKKVLGIWAQATAIVLPDQQGPPFTGLIEIGVSFEAGPNK